MFQKMDSSFILIRHFSLWPYPWDKKWLSASKFGQYLYISPKCNDFSDSSLKLTKNLDWQSFCWFDFKSKSSHANTFQKKSGNQSNFKEHSSITVVKVNNTIGILRNNVPQWTPVS